MKRFAAFLTYVLAAVPADAQRSSVLYPEPPPSAYAVSVDIPYGVADTTSLRMDVYGPSGSGSTYPALVIYAYGAQRANPLYSGLARIAASKGVVTVIADLRTTAPAADFKTLLAHLARHGSRYAIDTAAIAVFGASSNGQNMLPLVQDPAAGSIKAAVVYYSGPSVGAFRLDLPVLLIRSGLDRPSVNAAVDSLIARALAKNAPISVINYSGGHHGFESIDDNAITRDVIDQTIEFVRRVTGPSYRTALAGSAGRARAAAEVMAGDFAAASRTYAGLVAQNGTDARLHLSYAEAILADQQFKRACEEFGKFKGRGLLPRELGLPAARACLQTGDVDGAMAWLKSIPSQYMPARVKEEPVFAPLRDRADFIALFKPPS